MIRSNEKEKKEKKQLIPIDKERCVTVLPNENAEDRGRRCFASFHCKRERVKNERSAADVGRNGEYVREIESFY